MLPGITDDYKIGYKSPYRHVDRLTRVYEYMGPAWYQRDIEFPADWKGKCIFLYFERTHWLSSVWVDTKEVSRLDYISVPHNHDLTDFVTPGKTHRITVCIDNRFQYNTHKWNHAHTEFTQINWNGILGEIQLGAILSEILNSDQYDTEVATIPGSRDHVEFAVKLPAGDGSEFIYLPIDSKFPGDTYAALQDAYTAGDPEGIRSAYKSLETVIRKCAKDIHDKYIRPPYTTSFGIMFLPFEGLYAEVVNHGLVEILQRDYSVNIAGPSTMAAMLNSLQMGFKTLQIQKRSNEVWEILSAVKTEFDTFEKVFASAQNRIKQLDDDMQKLIGTRTRAIQRKLREVGTIDLSDSRKILELDDFDESES